MAIYPASFPLIDNALNEPTVLISPPALAPTLTNQATETPPAARYAMNSESRRQRADPSSDTFSPASVTAPLTSPGSRRLYRSGVQPLLLFVGILLVIALVVSGVLIGLQVNKSGSNPAVGSSTSPTSPQHQRLQPAFRPTQRRQHRQPYLHRPLRRHRLILFQRGTPSTIQRRPEHQTQGNHVMVAMSNGRTTIPRNLRVSKRAW